MTLLVGAHLGKYVVLAADSLQTFADRKITDAVKVVRHKTGLCAGIGAIDVFQPIIETLLKRDHTNAEISKLMLDRRTQRKELGVSPD